MTLDTKFSPFSLKPCSRESERSDSWPITSDRAFIITRMPGLGAAEPLVGPRLDLIVVVSIISLATCHRRRGSVDPVDANDRKIDPRRNLFEIAGAKPVTPCAPF